LFNAHANKAVVGSTPTDMMPRVEGQDMMSQKGRGAVGPKGAASGQITAEMAVQTFASGLQQIDQLAREGLKGAGAAEEVINIINHMMLWLSQCIQQDEAIDKCASSVALVFLSESNAKVCLKLMSSIRDLNPRAVKAITTTYVSVALKRKINPELTKILLKWKLVSVAEIDVLFADRLVVDNRHDMNMVKTVCNFIKEFFFKEKLFEPPEFSHCLSRLKWIISMSNGNKELAMLETFMKEVERQIHKSSGVQRITTETPETEVRAIIEHHFNEWIHLNESSYATKDQISSYLHNLEASGLLMGEDTIERLFMVSTDLAVQKLLRTGPDEEGNFQYTYVDELSQLILFLLRTLVTSCVKGDLLIKIFNGVIKVFKEHYSSPKFNQKPFYRLLLNLIVDFHQQESFNQRDMVNILSVICQTLYELRPTEYPGFCFAWLELMSHRFFMPKVINATNEAGEWVCWDSYQRLIVEMLRFFKVNIHNWAKDEAMINLYHGALRVLLVLVHDFPEFLMSYHFNFCNVIPENFIQMRNLILSAYPNSVNLPDPFDEELRVDSLNEIKNPPMMLSKFAECLAYRGIKEDIDSYLYDHKENTLVNIITKTSAPDDETQQIPSVAIHALVLYVGCHSLHQDTRRNDGVRSQRQSGEFFKEIIRRVDCKVRYYILNAIVNQLRYPNSHTYHFMCILLLVFKESEEEIIKEQITRVLIERLIVYRPHPWGLLITFMELVKNPTYQFWQQEFTQNPPELRKLFDNISQTLPSNNSEGSA